MRKNRKFVIEFINSITGCISNEITFETNEVSGLCRIVDPESNDIHPAARYDLTQAELENIKAQFGIPGEATVDDARLRSWGNTDELPYKVHTNRELALMLSGNKPLAAFSERYPSNPEFELIPERFFAPHVEAGLFLKMDYIFTDLQQRQTRVVLYAKQGEEWRINAYMLLKKTADKAGWSEGFERMEGSLLGYEDWQNDAYIEKYFKRHTE
jgi:hypothetical protein